MEIGNAQSTDSMFDKLSNVMTILKMYETDRVFEKRQIVVGQFGSAPQI